jgi:hypothetical protein
MWPGLPAGPSRGAKEVELDVPFLSLFFPKPVVIDVHRQCISIAPLSLRSPGA